MVIICIVNSFMEKELPISGTAPSGVPSITGEPTKQWINSPHAFLRLTQAVLRFINGACERWLPPEKISERHRIVRKREQDAYFYLRRQGYTMVAQNFRSPLRHDEIDLIGWEGRVLCFVEVKTRTSQGTPAESAVDKKRGRT